MNHPRTPKSGSERRRRKKSPLLTEVLISFTSDSFSGFFLWSCGACRFWRGRCRGLYRSPKGGTLEEGQWIDSETGEDWMNFSCCQCPRMGTEGGVGPGQGWIYEIRECAWVKEARAGNGGGRMPRWSAHSLLPCLTFDVTFSDGIHRFSSQFSVISLLFSSTR